MEKNFPRTDQLEINYQAATDRILEATFAAYEVSDEVGKRDLVLGATHFVESMKSSVDPRVRAKIAGYEAFLEKVEKLEKGEE